MFIYPRTTPISERRLRMKVYHGGEYPMTVYDVVYKDDLIYFLMYLGGKWTLIDARECTVEPVWMPSYEEEMGFDADDYDDEEN